MQIRKKENGIIYLRRSSSRQELSLDAQLIWALGKVKTEGLQVDATLEDLKYMRRHKLASYKSIRLDDAVTGGDLNRPGIQSVTADVLADPRISHVVFYRRDRFARPERAVRKWY